MRRASLKDKVYASVILGQSNDQIAKDLGITVATVKWYISQIFVDNKVNNRKELMAKVIAEVSNAGGV